MEVLVFLFVVVVVVVEVEVEVERGKKKTSSIRALSLSMTTDCRPFPPSPPLFISSLLPVHFQAPLDGGAGVGHGPPG